QDEKYVVREGKEKTLRSSSRPRASLPLPVLGARGPGAGGRGRDPPGTSVRPPNGLSAAGTGSIAPSPDGPRPKPGRERLPLHYARRGGRPGADSRFVKVLGISATSFVLPGKAAFRDANARATGARRQDSGRRLFSPSAERAGGRAARAQFVPVARSGPEVE
ncbi:hypothetical protein THAOC_20167, partial [Thalassiosira oceanica]